MNRFNRALVALSVCGGLFAASPLYAQAGAPQSQAQKPATTLGKFIPPIRGTADLEVAPAKSVVKKNLVVTTLEVRNPNQAPIAGLKCDEVWWSKSRSLVPGGGQYRHKKPLQPGERLTITIETQKDAQMDRNDYQFSHAWGQIRIKPVKKFQ
jgi:hypothetical protein